MTTATELGLGGRELVSFVGAGGKTTLMLALGRELVAAGQPVVVTTTTKMAVDQQPSWAMPARDRFEAIAALDTAAAAFLYADVQGDKIVGVDADQVDALFDTTSSGYVLVEADGAAGKLLKAPAAHEPVIPVRTTAVVVMASVDAIGKPVSAVTHRPTAVAAVLGVGVDHIVGVADMARVLGDRHGGLARIPEHSVVTVALAGGSAAAAGRVAELLSGHDRIERVRYVGDKPRVR